MGTRLHRLTIHGLGDHGAICWLHRDGFNRFTGFIFDVARYTGDRAAGAHASHEHVDGTIAIVPDLRTGGFEVDLWISRVIELTGHEKFRGIAIGNLLGFRNRTRHAFGGFG